MKLPPVPWVTCKTIFSPSTGLAGFPRVRFPAIVTRKSLPWEASSEIVAASVSMTTAGAIAPVSTVVAAMAAARVPAARAGEARTPVSTDPPAAPAAATPAARLKTFLRLSAWAVSGAPWPVEDRESTAASPYQLGVRKVVPWTQ